MPCKLYLVNSFPEVILEIRQRALYNPLGNVLPETDSKSVVVWAKVV